MTYCGIDAEAAQALFEILIFTRSSLEEVNLSGNFLRNEGVRKVLLGTSIAKNLKKILLADNQFNDDDAMTKAIEFCMVKNKTLSKYDFKYNNITDKGKFFLLLIEKCVTVFNSFGKNHKLLDDRRDTCAVVRSATPHPVEGSLRKLREGTGCQPQSRQERQERKGQEKEEVMKLRHNLLRKFKYLLYIYIDIPYLDKTKTTYSDSYFLVSSCHEWVLTHTQLVIHKLCSIVSVSVISVV